MGDILIRDAEIGGRPGLDARLSAGRIMAIGERLERHDAEIIDARGGALIPGLIDHHVHLLATAARAASLTLDEVGTSAQFAARLGEGLARLPKGAWLRATGYHDGAAGLLSRDELDRLAPGHPVRVQDRTGALWVLNSAALALIDDRDLPPFVERDADGRLTGRIWRGDTWLRERIGQVAPPLGPLGVDLVAKGLVGVTDASVTTDEASAALLAEAARTGALPLKLHLMSGGPLSPDSAFTLGPVKILLDDRDLPPIEDILERIRMARRLGRRVAIHCVTAAELAVTLAAFEAAGASPGDRIEHGGMIPPSAIEEIARLHLTVVTQSSFVFERGDRYLAEIEPDEQADLYRAASLQAVGVAVAGSSDAPYGALDPWAAMRAAVNRRTRAGDPLGLAERISPEAALGLYLGGFDDPGGPARRVAVGAPADLCLLQAPLRTVLGELDAALVAATFVGGACVHRALDA